MIILDTNVISEAMKSQRHPAVQAWLDAQAAETLYLTSITLAEMLFGVRILPAGKRKNALTQMLDGLMALFEDRVLAFDAAAAKNYAELADAARAAGKGFPMPDAYIAAIAFAHGFIVATRDVSPFKAVGLTVIDPWESMP
jgi:predicted nucleic acid-binding protein